MQTTQIPTPDVDSPIRKTAQQLCRDFDELEESHPVAADALYTRFYEDKSDAIREAIRTGDLTLFFALHEHLNGRAEKVAEEVGYENVYAENA